MGILYIVSTPIGNLEDVTVRALKILFTVDFIACEDTRKTGQLLKTLKDKYMEALIHLEGVRMHSFKVKETVKLISYYDEVEFKKAPEIVELLTKDKNVALVTDSGTPLISDPGFKLVNECLKREIKIISIPGPSSVLSALTVSGLPSNQFLFLGYLPAKKVKRVKVLNDLNLLTKKTNYINPTVIIFESPQRLKECLNAIKEVFGDIELTIARELTKIYEEVMRGKISLLINVASKIKGEIVLLFNIPPALKCHR